MKVLMHVIMVMLLAVTGVSAGTLARIYVVPSDVGLVVGAQQQFQVIGEDSDGNEVPVPSPVTWAADSSSGSVNTNGVFVAGDDPGQYRGAITVSVPDGPAASANIEVYPRADSGGYALERSIGSLYGDRIGQPLAVEVGAAGYVYTANAREVIKLSTKGMIVGGFNLNYPIVGDVSMAIDPTGNVVILDAGSGRLQIYSASGMLIRQWGTLGSGEGEFSGPEDIALGPDGRIYVADTGNQRIQVFDYNGNCTDNWPIAMHNIWKPPAYPAALCVDAAGSVLVIVKPYLDSIRDSFQLQKYDSQGQLISAINSSYLAYWIAGELDDVTITAAGRIYNACANSISAINYTDNGNGRFGFSLLSRWGRYGHDDGMFDGVKGVSAGSDGRVCVADNGNSRIQVFDAGGEYITSWASMGCLKGQFKYPSSITLDSHGNFYVADTGNYRVQQFDANGTFVRELASKRQKDSAFACPSGVAVGPSDELYVADTAFSRVLGYTGGVLSSNWNLQYGALGVLGAGSIVYNPTGYLYVTDPYNNMMSKWNLDGQNYGIWAGGLSTPAGISPGPQNYNYVANHDTNRIRKYNSGTLLGEWGSTGSGDGQLQGPAGLRVDSQGCVYVADSGNHRIQKFDSNGNFISKLGSKGYEANQFLYPEDLALDDRGNLYVADTQNHRVCKFVPFVAQSPAEAKLSKHGAPVSINGAVVTGAFPGFFYIEDDDRTAGVRVDMEDHGVAVGMRVDVTGTASSFGDERCIEATGVAQVGTGSVAPVAMNNSAIGGGDWRYDPVEGTGQRGVDGGVGLNNIGLLVRTAGRVIAIAGNSIYIDDGSNLHHWSGTSGIRVVRSFFVPVAVGTYVQVTGVCSSDLDPVGFYPLIRARSADDIVGFSEWDIPPPPAEAP